MGHWKKILPSFIWDPLNELKRDYIPNFYRSYSGEGEDLILAKIFDSKKNGFYIDVGCYHPKIFSNTYQFYKNGWSGINIDANPDSIKKFNRFRRRDINVNVGISQHTGTLEFFLFDESAVNTFSKELCEQRKKISWLNYLGSILIPTEPLSVVLGRERIPAEIDFLDVDVEGFDTDVLASNDWNRFLPKVVMVEDQDTDANTFEELNTFRFLSPKGYKLIAKTFRTLIFSHEDFLKTII